MSMIYQALRQLGSEDGSNFGNPARERPAPPRSAKGISRRVFLWCLVAGVLGSSIVTAWLRQGGARDTGLLAEETVAREATAVVEPAADTGQSVVLAAATAVVEAPAQTPAEALGPPPAPVPAVFRADRAEPTTAAGPPSALLAPAEPEPIEAPAAAAAPQPEEQSTALLDELLARTPSAAPARQPVERTVVAEGAVAEPEAAPRPAVAETSVAREDAPPRATAADYGIDLQPETRRVMQTKVRAKSFQIAQLTAALTHAVQAGDPTETDRLLAALTAEAGADSSYALNMLAFVALSRGNYAESQAILARILERDPDDANAGLNMAVVESSTGRVREARLRLERLTVANPDDERIGALLQSLSRR